MSLPVSNQGVPVASLNAAQSTAAGRTSSGGGRGTFDPQMPSTGRADLFDTGLAKLWLGFVVRSVRRHRRRAIGAFTLITLTSAFFALSSAKQYVVETNLTARPDLVTPAVANPERTVPLDSNGAVVNAEGIITADENLKRIVKQTNLAERYGLHEPKLAKLKRKLFFGSEPSKLAKEEDLIRLLRGAIKVDAVEATDSVTISVTWNEPVQARDIADAAQTNFLDDRRRSEIGPIRTAVAILQAHYDTARNKVTGLRTTLAIPVDSQDLLPESSPLKAALENEATRERRLENGQIELEATQQGFQYRYAEVRPPEIPLAPAKSGFKSIILGLLAGLITAAAVSVAADMRRGAIIEPWQVSRRLNLPVLAHIRTRRTADA